MLNNTIKPRVVSVTPDYTDMYLVPEWGISYIQNMTAYGLYRVMTTIPKAVCKDNKGTGG